MTRQEKMFNVISNASVTWLTSTESFSPSSAGVSNDTEIQIMNTDRFSTIKRFWLRTFSRDYRWRITWSDKVSIFSFSLNASRVAENLLDLPVKSQRRRATSREEICALCLIFGQSTNVDSIDHLPIESCQCQWTDTNSTPTMKRGESRSFSTFVTEEIRL